MVGRKRALESDKPGFKHHFQYFLALSLALLSLSFLTSKWQITVTLSQDC